MVWESDKSFVQHLASKVWICFACSHPPLTPPHNSHPHTPTLTTPKITLSTHPPPHNSQPHTPTLTLNSQQHTLHSPIPSQLSPSHHPPTYPLTTLTLTPSTHLFISFLFRVLVVAVYTLFLVSPRMRRVLPLITTLSFLQP